MDESLDPADVVSLRIEASPEALYAIVSDPARLGNLSPECTGGRWLDGASSATVGARFRGSNRRGVVRWSTTSTVVEADTGRAFSFLTKDSATQWTYRFETDGTGTVVTESRALVGDYPWLARTFTRYLLGGVEDHATELRAGMRATLDRLKEVAESA